MKRELINEAVLLLRKTKIFQTADVDFLKECLTSAGNFCDFKRGENLLSNNSYQQTIGLILTGTANVTKGKAIMSVLEKGSLFGAVTLFSEKPYYATEIMAATQCNVLFLSRELVCTLMSTNTAIAESYIAYLSQRIYFLTDKIDAFTAGSAESRLANYLLNNKLQNEKSDSTVTVNNSSLLARELNIGRASLYRAFDFFAAQGAIERDGKKITLTDEKKLIMCNS